MQLLIIIVFCIINEFYPLSAFWLIDDYWTTIYRSGHVEHGRSSENFIRFQESTNNMYIGYWISPEKNYHEAYGNVYSNGSDDRGMKYCGTFVDVYQNKSAKICGSFRVLSTKRNAIMSGTKPFEFVPIYVAIKNIEKAVEYLDWQIARYRTNSNEKWLIGSANILKRIAYFPHNGGQLKRINFNEKERNLLDNVQVLQRSDTFDPRDLYEQMPTFAPLSKTTTATSKKLTTKTVPKTPKTIGTTKKASTTMETPTEIEQNYDNLAGAGIEWNAIVEANPSADSAQKLEGGAILSIDDNELILPKQK